MLNDAYTWILGKLGSSAYTEQLPEEGEAICVRCVGQDPSLTLGSTIYHSLTFNILVRGTNDSAYTVGLAETAYNALHRNSEVTLAICSGMNYAYTDDNANIAYSFNLNLIM